MPTVSKPYTPPKEVEPPTIATLPVVPDAPSDAPSLQSVGYEGARYTATVTTRGKKFVSNSTPPGTTNKVGNVESRALAATKCINAPTVTGAPTIGVATPGVKSASVAFTPTSDATRPANYQYVVTSSPGGFTAPGAASPIVVSGLATGTPYTFTVKGRNDVGLSPASAASNEATPT
jgi:hypothetical protein